MRTVITRRDDEGYACKPQLHKSWEVIAVCGGALGRGKQVGIPHRLEVEVGCGRIGASYDTLQPAGTAQEYSLDWVSSCCELWGTSPHEPQETLQILFWLWLAMTSFVASSIQPFVAV